MVIKKLLMLRLVERMLKGDWNQWDIPFTIRTAMTTHQEHLMVMNVSSDYVLMWSLRPQAWWHSGKWRQMCTAIIWLEWKKRYLLFTVYDDSFGAINNLARKFVGYFLFILAAGSWQRAIVIWYFLTNR